MSRIQPGAVVLDQLRDRIVTGLYFGNWQPGERLPSIRDIADAESIDRKTAAAAYHRLEEEGLVEVKARSGVFLRDERLTGAGAAGPMQRLQRRWLKNTYDGARALGLTTPAVLQLLQSVADVERTPVPVIDADPATARTVAAELRECVGLDARPVLLDDVGTSAIVASAAFAVTTPYYAGRVGKLLRTTPLITATLSLELLHSLTDRAAGGTIVVAVPSQWIGERVDAALRHRPTGGNPARVVVAGPETDLQQLRAQADCVFVWPGCEAVLAEFEGDACVKPVRLLSEATLDRVRTVVLEIAVQRAATSVSRSSAGAARPVTAAPVG